jgi:hypothetical protein
MIEGECCPQCFDDCVEVPDLESGQVPMNNDKTFIALADVADL